MSCVSVIGLLCLEGTEQTRHKLLERVNLLELRARNRSLVGTFFLDPLSVATRVTGDLEPGEVGNGLTGCSTEPQEGTKRDGARIEANPDYACAWLPSQLEACLLFAGFDLKKIRLPRRSPGSTSCRYSRRR